MVALPNSFITCIQASLNNTQSLLQIKPSITLELAKMLADAARAEVTYEVMQKTVYVALWIE